MKQSGLLLNIKFVVLLLLTGIVASSAFFFFPEIKAAGVAPVLAIAFASSLTQLGAALYFIAGLRTFKPALKVAYIFLAIGIVLFSLSQVVPSLSAFTDILSRNVTVAQIFFVVPYLAGAIFMYVGLWLFAKLLGIKSFGTSILFAALCALAVAALAALTPHTALPISTSAYILLFGAVGWCTALSGITCWIAWRIRTAIGVIYKPAMLWLTLALAALCLTTIHEIVVKAHFPYSSYASNSLSVWPFLVVGILFLRAGLSFKASSKKFLQLPAEASFTDVVVAIAVLVSKPADVDETLDKMRAITSGQSANALSEADKSTLLDVYLRIEKYLVTEERLHTYTTESLRGNLPPYFLQALSQKTASTPS